jgi:hypothetical protein
MARWENVYEHLSAKAQHQDGRARRPGKEDPALAGEASSECYGHSRRSIRR